LSAMNMQDFRDVAEDEGQEEEELPDQYRDPEYSTREEEYNPRDQEYNPRDQEYNHSADSLDETPPDIASEVTVGKDTDSKYEHHAKKDRAPRSPKSKGEVSEISSRLSINHPTWSPWVRQQRGRRRSSSSPSVGGGGRKKYICEKFNDVFTRSSDLRVHRDTMHAGEKKYKCKDCGKLFSQKGSLNRHMAQVPHGDFKYRCPRCGQIFVYKEYLMTHLKFSIHCVRTPKQEDEAAAAQNQQQFLVPLPEVEKPAPEPPQQFLVPLDEIGISTPSSASETTSSPGYKSGPPGLRNNLGTPVTYPRQKFYSKPPPGLRIPPT